MPECPNKEKNLQHCNCTYEPCSRKGICCECLAYHREHAELRPVISRRKWKKPMIGALRDFSKFLSNLPLLSI